MYTVFHAANDDGLAFEIGEKTADVSMQFVAQRFVAEEGPLVLGGRDRIRETLGEGLQHVEMMRDATI